MINLYNLNLVSSDCLNNSFILFLRYIRSTLEEVLVDIDWDNNFDADNSDLEVILNADMRDEDPNLSISTNELYKNYAELFDLVDPT